MFRPCSMLIVPAWLLVAACSSGAPNGGGTPAPPADGSAAQGPTTTAVRCEPSPRMAVEGRASPYDSTAVRIGDAQGLICYGRPSARGRTMIGGDAVPFGRLWRTGANEPTIMHLPVAAEVAGIAVEPGSYSLYTIPGEQEWTVIVNRATAQWGHESAYTEEVRAQEVGQATVRSERAEDHVEVFTIRSEPRDAGSDVIMEWEHTRVRIPVQPR